MKWRKRPDRPGWYWVSYRLKDGRLDGRKWSLPTPRCVRLSGILKKKPDVRYWGPIGRPPFPVDRKDDMIVVTSRIRKKPPPLAAIPAQPKMRKCGRCGRELLLNADNFYRGINWSHWCRECTLEDVRERRRKEKEQR